MSSHRDRPLTELSTRTELTRRRALQLLAGSVAAAQAACVEPPGDRVRPYARRPNEVTPGRPRYFATAMTLDGLATGLLVESNEGRPTKIDGNPEHPSSLGASLAQHQASILDLYDPNRARGVGEQYKPSSWPALFDAVGRTQGPLWLVLPRTSSPLAQALLQKLLAQRPDTHVVASDVHRWGATYAGSALAFGRPLETQLDLTGARVVASFDAELFARTAPAVRWARDFAARKQKFEDAAQRSRLYVAEPMLTCTGSLADHRLAIRAGAMLPLLLALSRALRKRGVDSFDYDLDAPVTPARQRWVDALASDLTLRAGESLLVVGERQPAVCHALAHALNHALGNFGKTLHVTEPVRPPAREATLEQLTRALEDGQVGAVVIIDANPVYEAPALARALGKAKLSVHVDRYFNETSAACRFHGALSHYLESWGDARSADGTHTLVQPLIRPLYDTRSTWEVLAQLAGDEHPDVYTMLRDSLGSAWNEALALGFVRGSAYPALALAPQLHDDVGTLLRREHGRQARGLEVDLSVSPTILDERFANNPWLQELPHPRTKQTWGNAALLSRTLAERFGLQDGQVVKLTRGERVLELPVFIVPEHADDCISVELGYGKKSAQEPISCGVGGNGVQLMNAPGERLLDQIALTATKRNERLACTQNNLEQHGRELALVRTLREGTADLSKLRGDLPSTLPHTRDSDGPQWAMTIDTSVCNGCSACVIACQSENNIPVVGKSELYRGREMHWLRIDTYLLAGTNNVVHQPMMCQHCEHAPCEYVCPVFATEHSPDGLNEMVYNRCIGTRFCSANCPYKVRRFNFLHYSNDDGTLALQKNPQVTVRDRGVIEKCTYCVQRIRKAEYQARMDERAIRPGEVVTACQQACPTSAIQFGMLSDEGSAMVRGREGERAYGVLHELGTRPRTMYLVKLLNPHPTLEEQT